MHKLIFILFFTASLLSAVKAQQKRSKYADTVSVSETEKKYDDEHYENKDTLYVDTTLQFNKPAFDTDSVTAWKELKAFAYVKYMDSLLKAQKEKKEDKKEPEQSVQSTNTNWLGRLFSSAAMQVFLWVLAILFVLFILYKLFLTEGVFRKKSMAANVTGNNVEEEIITNESDLDAFIKQALQNGNYRLAVRYQYLRTLHKLAAKNYVQLAADKTNYQYVRELTNQTYQKDFAGLTLNYEYVWYGGFTIEENIYKQMEPQFLQFNNKL